MGNRAATWSRPAARNRRASGWLLGIILLAAGPLGAASGQEARPAGAAGNSLARYVPRQDLIFLLEFDGLDAQPDAWHATAAYKLLTETKMGSMLEDLARQGIEMALASAQPAPPIKSAEIVALAEHGMRQGGVVALWGTRGQSPKAVMVARGCDRPEAHRLIEVVSAANRKERGEAAAPAPIEKAGRTLHPVGRELFWWIEKGDLVFSDAPDVVLAVLDGQSPNAVDHPLRVSLAKGGDRFQPVAVGFADLTAVPPMPPEAVRLGLDGLKRFEFQAGFQDDALRSVLPRWRPPPDAACSPCSISLPSGSISCPQSRRSSTDSACSRLTWPARTTSWWRCSRRRTPRSPIRSRPSMMRSGSSLA